MFSLCPCAVLLLLLLSTLQIRYDRKYCPCNGDSGLSASVSLRLTHAAKYTDIHQHKMKRALVHTPVQGSNRLELFSFCFLSSLPVFLLVHPIIISVCCRQCCPASLPSKLPAVQGTKQLHYYLFMGLRCLIKKYCTFL